VAITAVHTANNNCIESKKKNMISKENDAPTGRHIACRESRVVILLSPRFLSSSVSSALPPPPPPVSTNEIERKDPYTKRRMDIKKVETREESKKE